MRRLFEGGVTKAKTLPVGGDYSRAVTIRGRRLIDEIRYVKFDYLMGVSFLFFVVTLNVVWHFEY